MWNFHANLLLCGYCWNSRLYHRRSIQSSTNVMLSVIRLGYELPTLNFSSFILCRGLRKKGFDKSKNGSLTVFQNIVFRKFAGDRKFRILLWLKISSFLRGYVLPTFPLCLWLAKILLYINFIFLIKYIIKEVLSRLLSIVASRNDSTDAYLIKE